MEVFLSKQGRKGKSRGTGNNGIMVNEYTGPDAWSGEATGPEGATPRPSSRNHGAVRPFMTHPRILLASVVQAFEVESRGTIIILLPRNRERGPAATVSADILTVLIGGFPGFCSS
jgi:hypothetical protein